MTQHPSDKILRHMDLMGSAAYGAFAGGLDASRGASLKRSMLGTAMISAGVNIVLSPILKQKLSAKNIAFDALTATAIGAVTHTLVKNNIEKRHAHEGCINKQDAHSLYSEMVEQQRALSKDTAPYK